MVKEVICRERIGARLRELREKKGMTLEQVGEAMACRPNTILRLEEGRYSIKYDMLEAMANLYGAEVLLVEK